MWQDQDFTLSQVRPAGSRRRNSVLVLNTCDPQHLQAHKWLERGGAQGSEVVFAKVQQGQGRQARQGSLCQQLYTVFLEMEFLQTLRAEIQQRE